MEAIISVGIIAYLLFMVLWNVPRDWSWTAPLSKLYIVGDFFCFNQRWAMFSPMPVTFDIWIIVEGEDDAGNMTRLDVLEQPPGRPKFLQKWLLDRPLKFALHIVRNAANCHEMVADMCFERFTDQYRWIHISVERTMYPDPRDLTTAITETELLGSFERPKVDDNV